LPNYNTVGIQSSEPGQHAADAVDLFSLAANNNDEEIVDAGEGDEDQLDSRAGTPDDIEVNF
jgi:hypothetical protein